jgi:hypothetical protein
MLHTASIILSVILLFSGILAACSRPPAAFCRAQQERSEYDHPGACGDRRGGCCPLLYQGSSPIALVHFLSAHLSTEESAADSHLRQLTERNRLREDFTDFPQRDTNTRLFEWGFAIKFNANVSFLQKTEQLSCFYQCANMNVNSIQKIFEGFLNGIPATCRAEFTAVRHELPIFLGGNACQQNHALDLFRHHIPMIHYSLL